MAVSAGRLGRYGLPKPLWSFCPSVCLLGSMRALTFAEGLSRVFFSFLICHPFGSACSFIYRGCSVNTGLKKPEKLQEMVKIIDLLSEGQDVTCV